MEIHGFDMEKSWDYENGFYLTSPPCRLAKAIAHWELYKMIVGIPGDVVEVGVYKGTSLIRWATYREMLELPESRNIIGFDAFGKFPMPTAQIEQDFVKKFEAAGGDGLTEDELWQVLGQKGITKNIKLIPGDICQNIPAYAKDHPELRVALLHLDADIFDPTYEALTALFDRIVPGGIVIVDDFGKVFGATVAVEAFFKTDKFVELPLIDKFPFCHIPAFIRRSSCKLRK